MKIFRLKNSANATWHISFERLNGRDYSLCGNADIKSYFEKQAINEKDIYIEDFKDNGRLCPSCVLKAYQHGLVSVKKTD